MTLPESSLSASGAERPSLRFMKATGPRVDYQQQYVDSAMERFGLPYLMNPQNAAQRFVAKSLAKLRLLRNVCRASSGPVFVSMMGPSESRILPFALYTEVIPCCFDCWPPRYGLWTSFFRRYRIRTAFFTARQSAEHFAAAFPEMRCIWLPEATDPAMYDPSVPWQDRSIDVLELGRKYDRFHERVTQPLAAARRTHLFEPAPGQIVFPGHAALRQGLAHSRVSICFPSSLTHPGRSGTVETLTHRYLESIASRCLVLGHAPREMIDLFGYNPVVEVEWGREAEQIESILRHPEPYVGLIEKNFRRLLEVAVWDSRIPVVLGHLDRAASVSGS